MSLLHPLASNQPRRNGFTNISIRSRHKPYISHSFYMNTSRLPMQKL